ncbi:MAG: EpsG family protein [Lachnospira sp.]|nr:EpsG family protein [Lachnospira sp.]
MYVLIFGVSAGFIYCSEKTQSKLLKRILIILALLIPSILAGLRDYSIGNDVLLYGNKWFERSCMYNSLFDFLEKAQEYSVDLGYATVNWCVSRFTDNPHFFYFVYELLQLSLLYFALKPFKDKISLPYAYLIYFFCYYNDSLNILRQIMAIIFVLFAYKYVVSRKLIKFILVILLAFSFHSSSIVGLALYPLSWAIENKQVKSIAKVGIIGVSLVLVVGYEQVFSFISNLGILSATKYSHYMTDTEVGGRFVRLTYWGILLVFMWVRRKRCESSIENYRTLEIYMIISAIMSLITFLGSTWIVRIAYYFDIYQVLFIPYLAERMGIKFGNVKKSSGYVILFVLVFAYWLITFVIRNGAATYPYMFMTY